MRRNILLNFKVRKPRKKRGIKGIYYTDRAKAQKFLFKNVFFKRLRKAKPFTSGVIVYRILFRKARPRGRYFPKGKATRKDTQAP